MVADDALADDWTRLAELRERESAIKAQISELRADIEARVTKGDLEDDSEYVVLVNGAPTFRRRVQVSHRFDVRAFKAAQPDTYIEFQSEVRSSRIEAIRSDA